MSDRCFVCRHTIHKFGNEWKCEMHCRCIMAGCVLDRMGDDPEQEKVRDQRSSRKLGVDEVREDD